MTATSRLLARPAPGACNDAGRPIGETHHLAKFSDAEVEWMRRAREGGMSYGHIAKAIGASKSAAFQICRGHVRAQVAVRWRPTRYAPAGLGAELADVPAPLADIDVDDLPPRRTGGIAVAELGLPPIDDLGDAGTRCIALLVWALERWRTPFDTAA